jgi:hypothetical protein
VRPAGRTHLEVKVLYRPDRGNGSPDGKGVRRETESEGSRRQNAGLTNRNRIEAAMGDEGANKLEVRYLYGTHGSRCGGHKREGGSALPGEVCASARRSYSGREAWGRTCRSQQRA